MDRMGIYSVCTTLLAVMFLLILIQTGVNGSGLDDKGAEIVVNSTEGIKYQISAGYNVSTLVIQYNNPTNEEVKLAGYVVTVDEQQVYENQFNLSEGEHGVKRINITPAINVNQNNHTVTFSTFGGHTQFNFTRTIDSSNPGEIPTPYISNVNVTEGSIDGEPSAVAKVTIVNPSRQLYGTKLMVHTVGTDGSLYPASVRPGDSRTITVELLDERGSEIAGEARLYTGNMTTEAGAMDQVEFAGQAGGETHVWNSSYDPVRPTWMDDHYRYENDSYRRSLGEKLSGGYEVGDVPILYLAVVLLVGVVVLGKFRR